MKSTFEGKPTKSQRIADENLQFEQPKGLDAISIKEMQSSQQDIENYIKQKEMFELNIVVGGESMIVYATARNKATLKDTLDKKLVTGIKDVRNFGRPRGLR
jgi:hypothetical protein